MSSTTDSNRPVQLKEELETLRKSMMENMDARPQSRGFSDSSDGGLDIGAPPINTAREQELAVIREQLEENQRLLQESEKTWTERLKETEELARKREEQLKVLGLVSNTNELKEKAMTDQQMSEKLVYFLHSGTNKIGRIDATEEQNIVIGGLGIQKEHCVITRQELHASVEKAEGPEHSDLGPGRIALAIKGVGEAKVFVNAKALKEGEQVELQHCDRLILGNSNIFRVVIPSARPENPTDAELAHESRFDWQCAMKELNSHQIKANLELEALAEKEKREMDARMKKMEEMYVLCLPVRLAEEKLARQRQEWEQHVLSLNEQMKTKELAIKTQMQSEGDEDKRRLAEQLAQQETKLAEELVKAEISFERKQQELVGRQKELEVSLHKQMREAQVLGHQKDRERMERAKFDDQLLHTIPLVNEANSIADELQKQTFFTLRLITSGPPPAALSSTSESLEDEEVTISHGIGAELKVEVNFQEAGTFRCVMWDVDQFNGNLYAMREMYQAFIEHNRSLSYQDTWKATYGDDCDPFYDSPRPQLIGKSFVFLRNLVFGCKIVETTPIFSHSGVNSGSLKCEISPTVLSHEWQACQHRLVETCPEDVGALELPTLIDFLGQNLRVNIFVERLRGIPGKLCKDAYVSYRWSSDDGQKGEAEEHTSVPTSSPSVDPQLDFNVVIERVITAELVAYMKDVPLEFHIYGIVPSSNLNKVASRAVDLKGASSRADLFDGDGSVQFFNADDNGRNTLLSKKKSMRRRKGKMASDEDTAALLEQCKEQLAVQEKTLAENTQELEHKTHEVSHLQHDLDAERSRNTDLRCSLESLERTNQLLKAKLEQQILKDSITTTAPDLQQVIPSESPVLVANEELPLSPLRSEVPKNDPAECQERPRTGSRRRSRTESDRRIQEAIFDSSDAAVAAETAVVDPPPASILPKLEEEPSVSWGSTHLKKESRVHAGDSDVVTASQRSVRARSSVAHATMSRLTTSPGFSAGSVSRADSSRAIEEIPQRVSTTPKHAENPKKSGCIVS
ncbi:hypothetical protein BBJ28_00006071 [Nothophytophthora sp. Chile5]|nr:hypothetical protein BBJ28_00006071 [Nothophytophthora sp. Chile5]